MDTEATIAEKGKNTDPHAAKGSEVTPVASSDQEENILDYLKIIGYTHSNFIGVHFNISKLMPYNRKAQAVEDAYVKLIEIFDPLKANCFKLKNNDMIAIVEKHSLIMVERANSQFKRLFGNDPLISDNHSRELFYMNYDLGSQWRVFSSLIKEVEEDPIYSIQLKGRDADASPLIMEGIKAETLTLIEGVLKQADMTNYLRRQGVYWYKDKDEPKLMFHHMYLSIEALQETLKISESLTGNAWLFKQITLYLDKQMLKLIPELLQQRSLSQIHFNLNLRSIITSHFHNFLQHYNSSKKITFFFDLVDIIAHPDVFSYGIELFKTKGLHFGVSNINSSHLAIINFSALEADMYKMNWSPNLSEKIEHFKDVVETIGSDKLILHRCDTEDIVSEGSRAGVHLFQGRGIDKMRS